MRNYDREQLLYGHDDTTRIVAVERAGPQHVRVYQRGPDDRVVSETTPFRPWMLLTDAGIATLDPSTVEIATLEGELPLRQLVRFPTWNRYLDALERVRQDHLPHQRLGNPVDQYLTASGRTLFKEMVFDDLVRLQIDLETAGFDATSEKTGILLIALSSNRGVREVIDARELGEAVALQELTERVRALDPDVIEGHNLYNFDIPFLIERARRHRVTLDWGRDGSPIRLTGTQRVKVGARSVPFQAASIYGRHIVDTYQQIQRYDAGGELESYGLKESIEALGLTRADRTFIPGDEIGATFDSDRQRVYDYALGDVDDVALLSSLTLPTEFYQSQILPRSLQRIAVGGPGEKINYLMTRVYLALGHSLPLPEPPQPYPGGYIEVRRVGLFRSVTKCDVESLYPAIMLSDRIAPKTDTLGVYLDLLEILTSQRLEAKRQTRTTIGAEWARWQGLQLSFKVLINSFYGYLGYSRALFNDFEAARNVTLRGQDIITRVVEELERAGAHTIEIDTDGVYFQPPSGVRTLEDEEGFVADIGARLPRGISLAHDGSYAGMISLKTKNYALVGHDNRVILKGSSLRSRREEPIFRRFLREATARFIAESPAAVRTLYLDTAALLMAHQVAARDICRWETITEKTYTSDANRRIALAAEGERIGERVSVYQRIDGSLGRLADYAGDEDVDYLLRRLRDMAERFRSLFADDLDFSYHFPALTSRTDLADVRAAQPVQQLSLF